MKENNIYDEWLLAKAIRCIGCDIVKAERYLYGDCRQRIWFKFCGISLSAAKYSPSCRWKNVIVINIPFEQSPMKMLRAYELVNAMCHSMENGRIKNFQLVSVAYDGAICLTYELKFKDEDKLQDIVLKLLHQMLTRFDWHQIRYFDKKMNNLKASHNYDSIKKQLQATYWALRIGLYKDCLLNQCRKEMLEDGGLDRLMSMFNKNSLWISSKRHCGSFFRQLSMYFYVSWTECKSGEVSCGVVVGVRVELVGNEYVGHPVDYETIKCLRQDKKAVKGYLYSKELEEDFTAAICRTIAGLYQNRN